VAPVTKLVLLYVHAPWADVRLCLLLAEPGRTRMSASMRTRLSRWLRDHGPLTKMVIAGCRPAGVSDLDRRLGCDERSSQRSDELLSVPNRSIRHPMLNARKAPGLTPFTDAPNLFRRPLGGDPL